MAPNPKIGEMAREAGIRAALASATKGGPSSGAKAGAGQGDDGSGEGDAEEQCTCPKCGFTGPESEFTGGDDPHDGDGSDNLDAGDEDAGAYGDG